ncbi:zinc transporter ZIP9-like [Antennarius striatus]|uniref:zinc transporter ZIP9-like n=1 Tax=Antennarius striatus TaxID=241820 RepID=UPI0035B41007
MDGGLIVTLVSIAMFAGTFLLGFIPLFFKLSERRLQFVTILGAGLLCGTAMAVVIPEGMDLLGETWRASCSDLTSSLNASDNKHVNSTVTTPSPKFFIGLALTLGFILMFVVDQIGSYLSTREHKNQVGITATLGLVIHAAADGFALGAAVATDKVTVQVIVFCAVILHKAPAACGLVSFLMHAGLQKKYIQGHLLAFSAAAPILAITSYFILRASGSSTQSQFSATGVGMLFSAGTFLYVATVHILPEVSRTTKPSSEHQQLSEDKDTHQRQLGLLESLTLIAGMGLPLLLALGLNDN